MTLLNAHLSSKLLVTRNEYVFNYACNNVLLEVFFSSNNLGMERFQQNYESNGHIAPKYLDTQLNLISYAMLIIDHLASFTLIESNRHALKLLTLTCSVQCSIIQSIFRSCFVLGRTYKTKTNAGTCCYVEGCAPSLYMYDNERVQGAIAGISIHRHTRTLLCWRPSTIHSNVRWQRLERSLT